MDHLPRAKGIRYRPARYQSRKLENRRAESEPNRSKFSHILKWDFGPVSFGNLVAGSIVSWSSPSSSDLLLSRCWRGVYLCPSNNLSDSELKGDPIKVCDDLEYLTRAVPLDWNRNGADDLI